MAAQTDVPIAPTGLLGSARRLFLHGLAVLAAAVLLGIAELVSLWVGALLVGIAMLVLAAVAALAGLIGRLRHSEWS